MPFEQWPDDVYARAQQSQSTIESTRSNNNKSQFNFSPHFFLLTLQKENDKFVMENATDVRISIRFMHTVCTMPSIFTWSMQPCKPSIICRRFWQIKLCRSSNTMNRFKFNKHTEILYDWLFLNGTLEYICTEFCILDRVCTCSPGDRYIFYMKIECTSRPLNANVCSNLFRLHMFWLVFCVGFFSTFTQ